MNPKYRKTSTKVLIGATGVLALAAIGIGAATAATRAPVTQTTIATTPTQGDPADAPGTVEDQETADAPEPPGDAGPDVEQTGEHTEPGDAPGSR